MKPLRTLLVFTVLFLARAITAHAADSSCIVLHKNGVTYQAWKYPNGKTRCARTIDAQGVANGVEYRWREDGSMSFILTNIENRITFAVALDEGGKCRGVIAFSKEGRPTGPSATFYPSGLVASYATARQEMTKEGVKVFNPTVLNALTQPEEGCPPEQRTGTASDVTHNPSSSTLITSVSVNP